VFVEATAYNSVSYNVAFQSGLSLETSDRISSAVMQCGYIADGWVGETVGGGGRMVD